MLNQNDRIYRKNGYKNREHYLRSLSEEHDVNYSVVCALASSLGRSEDFDGLINAIEDYAEGY